MKPQDVFFSEYSLVAKHMTPEHVEWSSFPSTDKKLLNIKTSMKV